MDARILLDEEVAEGGSARIVRAMLELTGSAPSDADKRPPLNLVLVLDRSGSMHGGKLEAAKRAAAGLVRRLSPRDLVGVVAYDDQVTTVAESGTGAQHDDLSRRIQEIQPGGSTNLSGGWLRGREMVEAARPRAEGAAVNRIILLTDGLANVGITDPIQLTGLTARANEAGITTTTIGFGADFDEHLLRRMADAGGGSAYYIEREDQAGDVFAEELEGLLAICAQNVRVTLTPDPAHVSALAVRHAYPSTTTGDTVVYELGDLYAREPKRLLVQAMVGMSGDADEIHALDVDVSADVILPDGAIEHREVKLPVTISRAEGPRVDPEVRREALLLEAAEARDRALEQERHGDFGGAQITLREASASLATHAAPGDEELREQVDDLAHMAARLEDVGAFDASDAKYLAQRSYDVMRSKRASAPRTSRVRRSPKSEPDPKP